MHMLAAAPSRVCRKRVGIAAQRGSVPGANAAAPRAARRRGTAPRGQSAMNESHGPGSAARTANISASVHGPAPRSCIVRGGRNTPIGRENNFIELEAL